MILEEKILQRMFCIQAIGPDQVVAERKRIDPDPDRFHIINCGTVRVRCRAGKAKCQ